jgi:tetratricopeptide (TPR) repeat protein
LARVDLDKADQLLARAVEQDPKFANAWELRAAVQYLLFEYGYSTGPRAESDQRTIEFATRAIAINPQSTTAIALLAMLKANDATSLRKRGDYEAITADFDRALAIDPRNASALNWRQFGGGNSVTVHFAHIEAPNLSHRSEGCARAHTFIRPILPDRALADTSLAAAT